MLFISEKFFVELWFLVSNRVLEFLVSLEGVCQEERCQVEYRTDKMIINRQLLFTYLYLLVYILLSSGVILYNKVRSHEQFYIRM